MSKPPTTPADLARAEERLRLAFDATGQGFWDWEVATDGWHFSEGFCSMLGYSPGELEPSRATYERLIHTEDRAAALALLDRCVADAATDLVAEYRLRSRDGRYRWILCRGSVVRRRPDQPAVRLLGVHIDISKRRAAEQALRRSEDRYRMLVESQGEGIGIVDGDEIFTYANPAAERIFGVGSGELVGRSIAEFVDAGQFAAVGEQTDRRRDGARDTYELEFTRADGARRILLVTATPRFDAGGDYVAAFGVFRDITARKRMEDALREGEERYRQLIESLPHGVALLQCGAVVFANQAALRTLGYEAVEQLRALHPVELLVEHERERVMGVLADLRDGKVVGPVHYRTRARHRSGRSIPVDAYVTRIGYRGEHALQLFMIDISEQLQAEQERARLEERLRRSQRLESIGRLAGGVAHDFNNLLSPILLYSELALQSLGPDAPHYEDFTQIRHAVNQAKRLTQQLLAFGRRQVLQVKILCLNDVVAESHQMLRRLIREDVEIVVELEADLDHTKADPAQLQQVLMNLAINAQDSMPQGGRMEVRTANVELDATAARERGDLAAGRYATLAVSDTGRGMDEETMRQIFEPFFTTKEVGKGTGLGLATVHGIVKQHGGHIEVESEQGQGTTFTVYLPCTTGRDRRRARRRSLAQVDQELRATVLVAEDDDQVRAQVQRILERFGLDVIAAVDGRDALRRAREHDGAIDLLLTDVIMPRMNGRELYTALRESQPEVQVVYMSGYTNDVIADQGVADKGVRFLQKPFSMKDLLDAVRGALGRE